MISTDILPEILAKIATLNSSQLDVVISASTALKAAKQAQPGLRFRQASRAKQVVKKGPSEMVSEHAKNPDYLRFKQADRDLKSFLKEEGKFLKDFSPNEENPPAVASFFEARQCWFRSKGILKSEESESQSKIAKGAPNSDGKEDAI